jgi:hypothetical protein
MSLPSTITPACTSISPTDRRAAGFWRSKDGQSAIDMSGMTGGEALAELLGQCATPQERIRILTGTLELTEPV